MNGKAATRINLSNADLKLVYKVPSEDILLAELDKLEENGEINI